MVQKLRPLRLLLVLAILGGSVIASSHGRPDILIGAGFLLWGLSYTNPDF